MKSIIHSRYVVKTRDFPGFSKDNKKISLVQLKPLKISSL